MWSLAWPWMLAALPLPLLVRYLMPPVVGSQDAGLKVPSLRSFDVLQDRSEVEQLMNWRFWLAVIAWILLVLAAARPERIGDELDVRQPPRRSPDGDKGSGERLHRAPRGRPHRPDPVR